MRRPWPCAVDRMYVTARGLFVRFQRQTGHGLVHRTCSFDPKRTTLVARTAVIRCPDEERSNSERQKSKKRKLCRTVRSFGTFKGSCRQWCEQTRCSRARRTWFCACRNACLSANRRIQKLKIKIAAYGLCCLKVRGTSHVRCWHKAYMPSWAAHVRFWG